MAKSKGLGALWSKQLTATRASDDAGASGNDASAASARTCPAPALEAALEAAQSKAGESRTTQRHAPTPHSKVSSARCKLRQERLEAIDAEQELWQKRIANAREQIVTLRAREEETSADLAALANLPAEIEQRRGKLIEAIAAAERERAQGGRRSGCSPRRR